MPMPRSQFSVKHYKSFLYIMKNPPYVYTHTEDFVYSSETIVPQTAAGQVNSPHSVGYRLGNSRCFQRHSSITAGDSPPEPMQCGE